MAPQRPLAADALLALGLYVVLTLGVTSAAEEHHASGTLLGALINAVLVGPLVLRRRAPVAVLAAVVCAVAVFALVFGPTGGEAAVLVALGTVASRDANVRRVWHAAGMVVVGLIAVALVLDPEDLLGPLAVGAAARARRGEMAALADRAARLERERAQEAELAVAAERARIAPLARRMALHTAAKRCPTRGSARGRSLPCGSCGSCGPWK